MLAGTYVSTTCAVVVIIMKTYAVHMEVLHVCTKKILVVDAPGF